MNFYSENDCLRYKKNKRRYLFIMILSFILINSIDVVLCFFVNAKNHLLIQIINTLLTIVSFFLVVYFLDTKILVNHRLVKHYELIKEQHEKKVKGKVVSIATKDITILGKILVKEIIIENNKEKTNCYLLSHFVFCYNVGDEVEITLRRNFIYSVNLFIPEEA